VFEPLEQFDPVFIPEELVRQLAPSREQKENSNNKNAKQIFSWHSSVGALLKLALRESPKLGKIMFSVTLCRLLGYSAQRK